MKQKILTDNLGANGKLAWTIDPEKIRYNRDLLRSVPFGKPVKLAAPDSFAVSLFSMGRYITLVRIKPDGTPDKMYFFDHDWDISGAELKIFLKGLYNEELEKEWFEVQWKLYQTFGPEWDTVELVKE